MRNSQGKKNKKQENQLTESGNMAATELENASKKITTDLNQEFRNLVDRINTIESKLVATVNRTNQNTDRICVLQMQLKEALAKNV